MGVDGIDKADIFDEYFNDNKPKVTNFEKIKAMDIDEMAEFLRTMTATYCEYCPFQYDCDKDEYQGLDCKGFLKQWLESEVRE